jgi:hypothetical protein
MKSSLIRVRQNVEVRLTGQVSDVKLQFVDAIDDRVSDLGTLERTGEGFIRRGETRLVLEPTFAANTPLLALVSQKSSRLIVDGHATSHTTNNGSVSLTLWFSWTGRSL